MKMWIFGVALVCVSCGPKDYPLVMEKPGIQYSNVPVESVISNSVVVIHSKIEELKEERNERYFEFRLCQNILKGFGLDVSVYRSNGVQPWIQLSSTNTTNVLNVTIPKMNL